MHILLSLPSAPFLQNPTYLSLSGGVDSMPLKLLRSPFSSTPRPFDSLPSEAGHGLLHPPRKTQQQLLPCPHLYTSRNRDGVWFRPLRCRVLDSDGLGRREERGTRGRVLKNADIATLGNLCVDIVLSVPCLPPASTDERKAYMEQLSAPPPDKKYWEAGGNCNLAIAAARIGLHCVALGHVGDEIYGHFLQDVLREEGISMIELNEDSEASQLYSSSYETLLCWVLVDPFQKHGFCSRADFSKEPAFSWMRKLSTPVEMAIEQSKILFCNGYVFDELFPEVIISALHCAINAGTAVFFDPGPRGRSLSSGDPEERRAMELFLRLSDVLLFTSEEAEALTGIGNPVEAGKELITRGVRTKWVIIKMGSKGSILISKSGISGAPAFKVNVLDTVGCGDSYTAAVAFGFLCNLPTVNTLTLANAVGAVTATGCGAGRNVADLDKVLELLRDSNLNEDDKSWNELLEENSEVPEAMLLSKLIVNGSSGRITRVPIQKVVSEVLTKLETVNGRRMCHLEG